MIIQKNPEEIKKMRAAGRIVGLVLKHMGEILKEGIDTLELDAAAERLIRQHGATPAFLGYHGFPASICSSINEEVVHGIPKKGRILKSGDIISIDVGARLDGFCADGAVTLGVGKVSDAASRLMLLTEKALALAIKQVGPGVRLGDVQNTVETFANLHNLGIVREYCGHGIGRNMHEDPSIPNYGKKGTGPLLKPGYALAIEPMLNAGSGDVKTLDDEWTVVTKDGQVSAHFEHTVIVTENGSEIITVS